MKRLLLGLLAMLPSPALAQQVSSNIAAPAVTGSLIVASTPIYLVGVNVTSGASAGYVMLFDSVTVPVDGAVTPARCVPLAANTGIDISFRASPLWLRTGAVVVFSTTGCYSKTISATAFIAADYR